MRDARFVTAAAIAPDGRPACADVSGARPDVWQALAALTPARVALGRAGGSVPTGAMLRFQLAHARARDAVHAAFEPKILCEQLCTAGQEAIVAHSTAPDRATYLRRPDLGRRLDSASREHVSKWAAADGVDLALIISDGLSATAAHRQAWPTVRALLPLVRDAGWRVAPVVVAVHGRVALEDEVGEILRARLALILIGERPGLGAPDSLGAYLVFEPRVGRTDAERNCVSNIRPEGLAPERAAGRLFYLMTQARHHRVSGVQLKDESALLEGDCGGGRGRESE